MPILHVMLTDSVLNIFLSVKTKAQTIEITEKNALKRFRASRLKKSLLRLGLKMSWLYPLCLRGFTTAVPCLLSTPVPSARCKERTKANKQTKADIEQKQI